MFMPDSKTLWSKFYTEFLRALPVLALLGTLVLWIDTRYMHREISDTRFLEIRIEIVRDNVQEYHRRIDAGETLSAQEQLEFDMEKDQLRFLMNERNKLLDLGGLPE